MTYELYLHERAFEFLYALSEGENTVLLHELKGLRNDPFQTPDFTEDTDEGVLNGVLISRYAILYHVDHAVKRVRIVDIAYADQV